MFYNASPRDFRKAEVYDFYGLTEEEVRIVEGNCLDCVYVCLRLPLAP